MAVNAVAVNAVVVNGYLSPGAVDLQETDHLDEVIGADELHAHLQVAVEHLTRGQRWIGLQ